MQQQKFFNISILIKSSDIISYVVKKFTHLQSLVSLSPVKILLLGSLFMIWKPFYLTHKKLEVSLQSNMHREGKKLYHSLRMYLTSYGHVCPFSSEFLSISENYDLHCRTILKKFHGAKRKIKTFHVRIIIKNTNISHVYIRRQQLAFLRGKFLSHNFFSSNFNKE